MPDSDTPAPRRHYLEFGGRGGEFFRIWIVNVLLTVLTVGIYSAWAKVRTNKYIYGNTVFLGGRFDYHARPLQILAGRAIAVALLLFYIGAQSILPFLSPLLGLLLLAVIPWLIVRARMFNMRYTSYRNVRFGFKPAYGDCYQVIYLWGLISILTFGLATPYAHYKRNQFIVANTRYGNLSLGMGDNAGSFFFAYFLTFVAGAVVVFPLVGMVTALVSAPGGGEQPGAFMWVLPLLLGLAAYYVVGQFLSAATLAATLRVSSIAAGPDSDARHQLGCDWSLNRLLFIFVTNFFAVILSFGILIPWARMRVARYQLSRVWIDVQGDIGAVVAQQADEVSAMGEEIGTRLRRGYRVYEGLAWATLVPSTTMVAARSDMPSRLPSGSRATLY